MNLRYTYVFQIGTNEHDIEVYTDYTEENGVTNQIGKFRNTRAGDLIKEVKEKFDLTKPQIKTIKSLMRAKEDGIITPQGEYHRY